MIKNGRPYTNENGWEDKDLISDFTYDEIRSVDTWIRENIRKNRSIYKGGTSYGLKHILQKDTGIYLTNNAFKDAIRARSDKKYDMWAKDYKEYVNSRPDFDISELKAIFQNYQILLEVQQT